MKDGTDIMTERERFEYRLEYLQKLRNAYLDDGDDQEAYWVFLEIQALLEKAEQ